MDFKKERKGTEKQITVHTVISNKVTIKDTIQPM